MNLGCGMLLRGEKGEFGMWNAVRRAGRWGRGGGNLEHVEFCWMGGEFEMWNAVRRVGRGGGGEVNLEHVELCWMGGEFVMWNAVRSGRNFGI